MWGSLGYDHVGDGLGGRRYRSQPSHVRLGLAWMRAMSIIRRRSKTLILEQERMSASTKHPKTENGGRGGSDGRR